MPIALVGFEHRREKVVERRVFVLSVLAARIFYNRVAAGSFRGVTERFAAF